MFPSIPPVSSSTGGLSNEPVTGDSLTQFIRALANFTQTQGQNTLNTGQQLSGQAAGGLNTASQTLQPTVDYWTKLLAGDPTLTAQAIGPQAGQINSQYDAAKRGVETGGVRGGYSSGVAAALPFQKAGAIGGLIQNLVPQAAQGLQSAAQTQGGFSSILGNIGQGITNTGAGLLGLADQSQLARRGQNVSADASSNPFTALMGQGIGLLGSAAGMGLGKLFPKV